MVREGKGLLGWLLRRINQRRFKWEPSDYWA